MNHRHGWLVARVVTRPFTERPFRHHVFNPDFAFDGDLSIGGNRQTRERPVNNLQRLAENAAVIMILVDPVGHVGRSHDEFDRMMAEGNCDGKWFPLRVIFVLVHAPMFPRRHMQREAIRTVNHDSISTHVHPVFFRVARDYQIVSADIASAVELMPARYRKLEHVDVFALLDVFEERSGSNRFSGDRCNFLHLLAPSLDKIHIAQTRFHAERQRQTVDGRH